MDWFQVNDNVQVGTERCYSAKLVQRGTGFIVGVLDLPSGEVVLPKSTFPDWKAGRQWMAEAVLAHQMGQTIPNTWKPSVWEDPTTGLCSFLRTTND
jgi:hypothetical protein